MVSHYLLGFWTLGQPNSQICRPSATATTKTDHQSASLPLARHLSSSPPVSSRDFLQDTLMKVGLPHGSSNFGSNEVLQPFHSAFSWSLSWMLIIQPFPNSFPSCSHHEITKAINHQKCMTLEVVLVRLAIVQAASFIAMSRKPLGQDEGSFPQGYS